MERPPGPSYGGRPEIAGLRSRYRASEDLRSREEEGAAPGSRATAATLPEPWGRRNVQPSWAARRSCWRSAPRGIARPLDVPGREPGREWVQHSGMAP